MHAFIIEARAFSFMLCISTCYVFVLCPTIMILSRLVYNPFLLSTLVKSNEHIHNTSTPTLSFVNRLWAQTLHHNLHRRNHHHLCSGVARSPRAPPSSSRIIVVTREIVHSSVVKSNHRRHKGDCPFLRRQGKLPSSSSQGTSSSTIAEITEKPKLVITEIAETLKFRITNRRIAVYQGRLSIPPSSRIEFLGPGLPIPPLS